MEEEEGARAPVAFLRDPGISTKVCLQPDHSPPTRKERSLHDGGEENQSAAL